MGSGVDPRRAPSANSPDLRLSGCWVVLDAGFDLLATFSASHYSVVLPSYDVETTQLLSSLFGKAQRNIYFGRSDPA